MNCLSCYQTLMEGEVDFHAKCSRKLFGTSVPPELPYDETQMNQLALQVIQNNITLTGVQPKLSLTIEKGKNRLDPKRLTIVGMWGNFILKPPTLAYPEMPEVEDLTMHLAEIAKISVVPHTLVRMKSGQLAYLTNRIDRTDHLKIHMEDMCQLTERLTEHKYQGSHEQVAKTLARYSKNPGLDVVNFYELVLFSFLTGNADMHLKNFSIIYDGVMGPVLSPAYDLLSTALVNPKDDEDLALNLNGKKKKLKRKDFESAFDNSKLDAKQQINIFRKMEKAKPSWFECIQSSFLSLNFKNQYIQLIEDRFAQLSL